MEKFDEKMLRLQIRNLEEQVRILRKEKETCEQKIAQLEESVNMILKNEGMLNG